MILCQLLYCEGGEFASSWNFGPRDEGSRTVSQLIDLLANSWGDGAGWEKDMLENPHEAGLLKLDWSKAHEKLSWSPKWSLETAIMKTIDWHKSYISNEDMLSITLDQIKTYQSIK